MESPSAIRARPFIASRLRPVIRATVLTWPMFSATSTSTTGRKRNSTFQWNSGAWKGGRPIQAASPTGVKSTWPCTSATRYPTTMPMRMDNRPSSPVNSTAATTIARVVAKVVSGTSTMAWVVEPARFSPISATMVPITTGGISAWIQPVPARCTMSPTRNRATPVVSTPPRAPPMPCWFIAAEIGAMNAKELPR